MEALFKVDSQLQVLIWWPDLSVIEANNQGHKTLLHVASTLRGTVGKGLSVDAHHFRYEQDAKDFLEAVKVDIKNLGYYSLSELGYTGRVPKQLGEQSARVTTFCSKISQLIHEQTTKKTLQQEDIEIKFRLPRFTVKESA